MLLLSLDKQSLVVFQMSMKKVITLFILFYSNIFPQEFGSEVLFSSKIEFRNGFEIFQLLKRDKKFTLAKLSYNNEKKWEETRILGFIEEIGHAKYKLKSEFCSVYATQKLGQRWVLVQGFDCDHMELQLTENGRSITISPSIGILDNLLLNLTKTKLENTICGIVLSEENGVFQVWSLEMRYVKKGASATVNGKPIQILETVDSTGTFSSKELVYIGDIVSIKNRTVDLFD